MFLIGGVVVLFLLAVIFLRGNTNTDIVQKAQYPIVYLKKDTLYSYDLKGEPQKVDRIKINKNSDKVTTIRDEYIYNRKGVILSEDSQKLFYENNITDTQFELCYKDLKTGDKKVIAKEVVDYNISPDGNYCTYSVQKDATSKANAYIYDVKNGK